MSRRVVQCIIFGRTRDPYSTGVKRTAGKSTGVGPFKAITFDLHCPHGRLGVGPAGPRPSIQRLDPALGARRRSDFRISLSEYNFHRLSYLCEIDYRGSCSMNASLVNVSDRRFKRLNPERRVREERRFQAELAAHSTPALAVRTVVGTPEAQKRGKRRDKPLKHLSKKRRAKKRCQAAAQAPPRDVISHPSPPSASSSASCFKYPPIAPPKVPSWTSTISFCIYRITS